MSQALIVFAKVPEPGAVKTRLTSVLTPLEAARLYEAFLQDALQQYSQLNVAVRLYLAPPIQPVAPDLVCEEVTIHEQQGASLGPRMHRAFIETMATGHDQVVIIGTDHPTLPTVFIQEAFAALESPCTITIGPSDDGGYYLLGMNDFYPSLFEAMAYSHTGVFEDTLHRAGATQAALTILPPWYDIDTPATLRRLIRELQESPAHAPHTRAVVESLRKAYPELFDRGSG